MHSVVPLGSRTQLSVFHRTLFQAQFCPKFSVIQSLETSSNTLLTTVPLNHLCPLTQSSFIKYVHSSKLWGGQARARQIIWVQIMNAIPSRCRHAQGQSVSNLQGNQLPPASWCLARFERALPHTSNKISDKSAALRNRQAVRSRAGVCAIATGLQAHAPMPKKTLIPRPMHKLQGNRRFAHCCQG